VKVLIIGGTGNISTAITRCLAERGDDVTLYSRGRTQTQILGRYDTILGDRYDHATFETQRTQSAVALPPFPTLSRRPSARTLSCGRTIAATSC